MQRKNLKMATAMKRRRAKEKMKIVSTVMPRRNEKALRTKSRTLMKPTRLLPSMKRRKMVVMKAETTMLQQVTMTMKE